MNGVDLGRFEFDYDTTWAAFFADADLNIYSRYGGRDESGADSRLSIASLVQTMHEVLEVHTQRSLPGSLSLEKLTQPVAHRKSTPEDIPLLKANHQGCVHCHQVQEYRYLQSYRDGTFRSSELFKFPLPENIGLKFDRDHGHRVAGIFPGSPTAGTLLAKGDVIERINDVPIHSEEDARWALHRAPDGKPIVITVQRRDPGVKQPMVLHFELRPTGTWRQTELDWRKSLRSVPFALGFLGYDLGREELKSFQLPEGRLAIRVVSVRGAGLASNVGLKKGDHIIAVGDQSRERTFQQFKSDLLRTFAPGDELRMTVLRDGRKIELKGAFPAWQTADTSVP